MNKCKTCQSWIELSLHNYGNCKEDGRDSLVSHTCNKYKNKLIKNKYEVYDIGGLLITKIDRGVGKFVYN